MIDYIGTTFGNRLYGGYSYCGTYGNYNEYQAPSSLVFDTIANNIATQYSSSIDTVRIYMEQGNIDEALSQYNEIFDDAKQTAEQYGYTFNDRQISSIVEKAYTRETGTTLTGSIEKNTSNPFVTGLKNGVPVIGWFFGQSNSDADALAKLSGTNAPAKATAAECVGGILSGAASGAAIGAGLGLCGGPLAPLTSTAGAIGGAIIGAIGGLLRGLF